MEGSYTIPCKTDFLVQQWAHTWKILYDLFGHHPTPLEIPGPKASLEFRKLPSTTLSIWIKNRIGISQLS